MTHRNAARSKDARDRIRRGVDTLDKAVRVTLGPRGRTVLLERDFSPPQIVNSGVVVARSVELEDHFENMGAQLLREMAGDGTTTATRLPISSTTPSASRPCSRTWPSFCATSACRP